MSFDPIEFLEKAVQTPSNEAVDGMRDLLVDTLEAAGVNVHVDTAGNVIAEKSAPGEPPDGSGDAGPRVLLNTHIDTVSPHLDFDRSEGRIHGRGSCDAKGPLAAMLDAFLATEPTEGGLVLAVTPDEERESTGAAALDLGQDMTIVGEPTDLDVCTAARGRFQGTVQLRGKGAHAAEPATGANAISAAAQVLAGLDSFDTEYGPTPHPLLGPPTLTPTLIDGGEASNRVPATVEITIDRRSVPPEGAETFFGRLHSHLAPLVPEAITVEVTQAERDTPFLEAFETAVEEPVVTALNRAGAGEPRPFGAATEASYFADRSPTVVFGPGVLADDAGPVAHSDREYVEIEAVESAGTILKEALATLLGRSVPDGQ